MMRRTPGSPLFPYTTLFRSPQLLSRFPVRIRLEYPPEDTELEIINRHVSNVQSSKIEDIKRGIRLAKSLREAAAVEEDRKSTRLNSSHGYISYAVFCLKNKR